MVDGRLSRNSGRWSVPTRFPTLERGNDQNMLVGNSSGGFLPSPQPLSRLRATVCTQVGAANSSPFKGYRMHTSLAQIFIRRRKQIQTIFFAVGNTSSIAGHPLPRPLSFMPFRVHVHGRGECPCAQRWGNPRFSPLSHVSGRGAGERAAVLDFRKTVIYFANPAIRKKMCAYGSLQGGGWEGDGVRVTHIKSMPCVVVYAFHPIPTLTLPLKGRGLAASSFSRIINALEKCVHTLARLRERGLYAVALRYPE